MFESISAVVKPISAMLLFGLFACADNAPAVAKVALKDSAVLKTDSLRPMNSHHPVTLFKDTFLVGNFDKLKGRDTAWLMVPMDTFEIYGCNPCYTRVKFSNKCDSISFTEGDVGGKLANAGDLNKDDIDELLYYDAHFTGCWARLRILSLQDHSWKEVVSTQTNGCAENQDLKKRIRRTDSGQYELIGDDPHGGHTSKKIEFK